MYILVTRCSFGLRNWCTGLGFGLRFCLLFPPLFGFCSGRCFGCCLLLPPLFGFCFGFCDAFLLFDSSGGLKSSIEGAALHGGGGAVPSWLWSDSSSSISPKMPPSGFFLSSLGGAGVVSSSFCSAMLVSAHCALAPGLLVMEIADAPSDTTRFNFRFLV